MTPTPTPTAAELQNATSGFASSTDLTGPLIIVIYIVGALMAAQFVAPWLARSTLLTRFGDAFTTSLAYALKGLGASAVLAAVAAPGYLVWQADSGTRAVAARYIGYGIVAYIALMVVGWMADRAVTKFIEAHPEYESFSDIFPESTDLDEEVAEGAD